MNQRRLHSLLAALILIGLASLAGCNTMEGFGEDVQSAGEAIEESADGDEQDTDNDY